MALTRSLGRRLPVLLAALALALAAPAVRASLRQTYAEALAAMQAESWPQAERLFRAAIELRSSEARRLTLKRIHQPYLPHYYLGAVLARQGDCRGALEAWQRSQEQQVVAAIGLQQELDRRRMACESRLERLAERAAETEALLTAAASQAERLGQPERAHLLGLGYEGGFGTVGQRLDAAREAITESREEMRRAQASQDLELATATLERARETARELDAALEEIERLDREVAAARATKRDRIEEVRELARRVDGMLRSRSPLPPALRGRRQRLESLLSIALALPETATLKQIAGLERGLLTFKGQLQRSAAPPPGTLRSGAIAFLRADYRAVLERLEKIPYGSGKARAHCLLLRSAAAFALHVAGGEADSALLERARADAAAARRNVADLRPTTSAFSPRFVRFFEAAAGPVPGA